MMEVVLEVQEKGRKCDIMSKTGKAIDGHEGPCACGYQ